MSVACVTINHINQIFKKRTHIKGLEDRENNVEKEKLKMRVKEGELLNNNKYAESIKFVNSITDFECRDNIFSHEKNEELYEELDYYIKRFINNKCN